MADKKFSEFTNGSNSQVGDTVVGLRSATNYKFSFPGTGINDENGNPLLAWVSGSAAAVNYLSFSNASSGSAVVIESLGSDTNIHVLIRTKGAGEVQIPANITQVTQIDVDNIRINGNTISSTNTNGNIDFDLDGAGLLSVNATTGIDEIINDDTMATATATNLSSSLAIVNYIASQISGAGISWYGIAGTTQTAAVNSGYVIQNSSQTTVTLPTTAALGDIVIVQGLGAAGWILEAGAGQTIQLGSSVTSSGGTLTSAAQWDAIEVVCVVANTTWATRSVLSTGLTVA